MLKVQLTRDLRKSILRGHPWVYREAIQVKKKPEGVSLCEVQDKKGQSVAWAIYSPEGPLALRILSTDKKPPNQRTFDERMQRAWDLRSSLRRPDNNAYRLFNGEGDYLPGLVCDLYNHTAVLQFDGDSCYRFWNQEKIAHWLLQKSEVKTVYCKPRRSENREALSFGQELKDEPVEIVENGVKFLVNVMGGQKTGFFLDQRDNRQYLRGLCSQKSVLNLFSYTGGFSIYAGLGGASKVKSVDIAEPALQLAQQSWQLNGLSDSLHQTEAADVFEFLQTETQKYQVVMVDPPSMTHSEKTKSQAVAAYTDLFAKACRLVQGGDHLVLSSCSSHISMEDFLSIIEEALSTARRKGQILRVSGQGMDHPFPHFCRELQYLKFVDLVLN